nr:MAG TPA: hypothetical protein [Caudoviricetes sp.]
MIASGIEPLNVLIFNLSANYKAISMAYPFNHLSQSFV